jgi:exodeoxyribonuclease V gamma subunit
VRFDDVSVTGQDQEPFALDALAPFGLGSQLLEAGLHAGPSDAHAAVAAEARRLTRTGDLPMAGFGRLAAEDLAAPVMDMLTSHQALLEQWPCACDPMEISLTIASDEMPPVVLDDWLDQVYVIGAPDGTGGDCGGDSGNRTGGETVDGPDASGGSARFARWEFYPKSIMGSKAKISLLHPLAGLWVKHVAACAQGIDLASHLVAPDKTVSLPPIAPSRALEFLSAMVLCLFRGLCRPLPVTAKTGLAYAHAVMFKEEDQAKAAAARAYEGDGYNFGGELAYDPCLQRTYPGFEDLWQAHDNQFVSLCRTLYEPLVLALEPDLVKQDQSFFRKNNGHPTSTYRT